MTQLIEKTDPRYFTVTSDEPYDRHTYKVVYHGGKEKVVDSWEEVQSIWGTLCPISYHMLKLWTERKQNQKVEDSDD